jgi:hypothetical protein
VFQSPNAAMKSLFDALNIVYAEQEKRGFVKLNAVSLTFTAAAVAFALVAIAAVVVLPVALNYLGLSDFTDKLLRIVRWPTLFVALTIALALIYRFGPTAQRQSGDGLHGAVRWLLVLWLAASALFSFYAATFGNFNETYGSLGAVIGFMTWLWISAIVVLLGAELDAEMGHQTARDSTTGTPKPLGNRGARMADSVGAVQTQARKNPPLGAADEPACFWKRRHPKIAGQNSRCVLLIWRLHSCDRRHADGTVGRTTSRGVMGAASVSLVSFTIPSLQFDITQRKVAIVLKGNRRNYIHECEYALKPKVILEMLILAFAGSPGRTAASDHRSPRNIRLKLWLRF